MGREMEELGLPVEVRDYLQSVSNAEVALFVADKRPASVREAQDMVAELGAPPVNKTFMISYGDSNDYGFWARGTVNGRPASFMPNYGSDALVSASAVNRLGLTTTLCRPFRVDGSPVVHNRKVSDLVFELDGGYKGCMDFYVGDGGRNDFVFGNRDMTKLGTGCSVYYGRMLVELRGGDGTFTSPLYEGRPGFH